MAHSPHRPHKGCQLCKPHKNRRAGRAVREPWAVLRATGKRRRVSRGDLGDAGWRSFRETPGRLTDWA